MDTLGTLFIRYITPNCTLVELKLQKKFFLINLQFFPPNCTLVELKLSVKSGLVFDIYSKLYLSGIEIIDG